MEKIADLLEHARRELDLAGWTAPDSMYDGMIGDAVIELMTAFANQGHSGMSASIVTNVFNLLSQYKTLTDNDHSVFEDVSEMWGSPCLQDMRDFKWFSKDGGRTWENVDTGEVEQGAASKAVDALVRVAAVLAQVPSRNVFLAKKLVTAAKKLLQS